MAAAADDAVVVYDVPLLAETDAAGRYDVVVVVEAPLEVRLERLEARGLPREQAQERIAKQASDAERRAVADVIVPNGGDRAALTAAVAAAWPRISGADRGTESVAGLP